MGLEQQSTDTLVRIRTAISAKPDGILEMLAEQHSVPLRIVMDCLPDGAVSWTGGDKFIEVLGDISEWGDVTLICHSKDAVIEITGPLPIGKIGHGMYNLQGGRTGLSGHLRPERCAAIYFVSRPFMGMETKSVQFFNAEGGAMFKIYVGRDEQRRLRGDQVERFERLRSAMQD